MGIRRKGGLTVGHLLMSSGRRTVSFDLLDEGPDTPSPPILPPPPLFLFRETSAATPAGNTSGAKNRTD